MTRILIICLLLCATQISVAQNDYWDKHVKPSKESNKKAKELEKQGWFSEQKTLSIAEQIENCQLAQYIMVEDGNGISFNRYLIVTSEATSKNPEIARNEALANCQAQISQSLKTNIASLNEHYVTNKQKSSTDAKTEESISSKTISISQNKLREQKIIQHINKKNADGTTTVLISLIIDKESKQQ